ncbi:MAG: phage tail tube protein [Schwartzia sp.]|nr:phage tail tube protein [Schwartzia sp. (in: firmicutes)]
MARATEDVKYRGRRRWNGSHGKLWWDGLLLFEIASFEATVTADREDVYIGNSKDSKVVSLTGEGSFTIRSVINRNINRYLEEWKAGHDPRATLVGLLDDPDMVDGQKERCSIDNVWFNELTLMKFSKAEVVEKEFPFGFTPEDASFIESVGD